MLGSGSIVVMDETDLRGPGRVADHAVLPSGVVRPVHAVPGGGGWLEKILRRIEDGYGREEDLDLLMDVCDNIAPGLGWPPQQTTICVLGPSIPSSIVSGIRMFRDEFLLHVKEGGCPMLPRAACETCRAAPDDRPSRSTAASSSARPASSSSTPPSAPASSSRAFATTRG